MSEKEFLLNHNLQKVKEALKDAQVAIDNDRLHNAYNRIYYAIFFL